MFRGLSARRRAVVLGAVVVSLVVATIVAVVLVRAIVPGEVRPADQSIAGPVVLVPGFGGGTTALQVLAAALEAAGRDTTIVPATGDDTGDLRDQAATLDRTVDDVLKSSGAPSVDVVGFSAGGVVARLWARDDGGASKARRIVTLGSPHHGTDVASLASAFLGSGCPEACQQLRPDSDLLTALNDGDETPAGPVWTAIWSNTDETVTPPTSASLVGATDIEVQQVCPGLALAHGDLPRDPVGVGLVLEALSSGTAPATDGSDCDALRASGQPAG